MYMYVHVCSCIETRQCKATTPKDNSSFFPKRKRRATSGGIQTCNILRARQTLYQLSHRGSSAGQAEPLNVIQGQRCLFPDKQGICCNSFQYYVHEQSYLHYIEERRKETCTCTCIYTVCSGFKSGFVSL